MDRTKSETEARMMAAAAGSAIGTTTIEVRRCLKTRDVVV